VEEYLSYAEKGSKTMSRQFVLFDVDYDVDDNEILVWSKQYDEPTRIEESLSPKATQS